MKVSRMLAMFSTMLLLAGVLYADTTGKWQLISLNFNSGNTFFTGGAVGENIVVAGGMEKDPSGSNTTAVFKKSSNGGQSFANILPQGYMMVLFTDVDMVSEDFGLAIGNILVGSQEGPIWKITNKGNSMEALVPIFGEFHTCEHVFCLNESKCWVSCNDGVILRTDSGAEVWAKSTLPTTDFNSPGPIHFINDQVGFVAMGATDDNDRVLTKGQIFKTTNGGASWTAITDAKKATYYALWFLDANTGFVAEYDGSTANVYKTTDGGGIWNTINIEKKGTMVYVGGIEFMDQNNGWMTASYGTTDNAGQNSAYFYRTYDGGDTWTTFVPVGTDGVSAIAGQAWDMDVINEHLAYSFGEYQAVVKYTDGVDPIEDGDTDPADGDGTITDGDSEEDVDTGPIYNGKAGEPCPVMDDATTWDIPRCNIEYGSDLCLWQDEVDPFCTSFCEVDEDCKKFGADACCKPIDFEGVTVSEANASDDDDLKVKRACFLTNTFCADYSGMWYGYNGALPGEACHAPGFEEFPKKDPNYGGDFCIDEQRGGDTFVSSYCTEDDDCAGGFMTEYCCDGEAGDKNYCRYEKNCDPNWDPSIDGDFAIDGDNTTDGDVVITDGDTTVDGDTGSNEDGGSGCASTTTPSAIMLAFTMLGVLRRRMRK